MNQDLLRKRTEMFLRTLNLPISRFAKVIGIERSSYYKWKKRCFDFGELRAAKIDEYLSKFGF